METRAFSLTTSDGLVLPGRAWLPDEASAVIVLVHGLGEHSGRYIRFAAKAIERGVAIVSADLRGHGRSPGEPCYINAFSDYLADTDALVAKAREIAGSLPLFMMGHSLGGAIAMRWLAERRPARAEFAGLILSSAALKVGCNVSRFLLAIASLVSRIAPRLRAGAINPALISRIPGEVEAYRNDPLVCHIPPPARTGAELLAAIAANRAAAATMMLPVLLLHGDADMLTDPAGSREIHAAWGARDKTLRLWPGSLHETLNDLDGAAVAEEIFGWVAARRVGV